MRSAISLIAISGFVNCVLGAPAPVSPADFNPANFNVQPDTGNAPQDDCGGGPISLDVSTWNAHNMDSLIQQIWDSGNGNNNFDFHQAFASKYTDDLSCPDSFTNCVGDPSSCSALSGSTSDKEQGWLGIKAILNVQGFFLQLEKVVSNAADGISGSLVDFQNKFSPPTPPVSLGWVRTATSVAASILGFGLGAISAVATSGLSPLAAAAWGAAASNTVTLVNNEWIKDGTANALDITKVSDQWNDYKTSLLTQIDHAHSAVFSNGMYNGQAGARIIDYLSGGEFAGSQIVSAYEEGEGNLQTLMESLFASKLLEAIWTAQNAFIIFIPNVTKDCPKWKKNAGNGERRLCAPEGMYLLNRYDPTKGNVDKPPVLDGSVDKATGMDPTTVASWGGYNIDIHDLIQSSASVYQAHGLGASAAMYDFLGLIKNYKSNPKAVFQQQGMFTIPVCQLQAGNWRQSDNMRQSSPPCDCLTATDQWGNKFMDATTSVIQDWIKSKCS